MDRLAIFLVAVIPGLLVLCYGVAKTRINWSNEALSTAFLVGGVGVLAAVPIELGLKWLLNLLSLTPLLKAGYEALFVAAIPEELIKFIILVGVAETHVDARRRQDIIALAIAVSLGFATIENLFYVIAPGDWRSVAALRSLSAVPGHGIDGLIMGSLLTLARLSLKGRSVLNMLALLVPIATHAAYDFPIFAIISIGAAKAGTLWPIVLWLAVSASSAIAAIVVCNISLPAAAEADRVSGRDVRPQTWALPIAIGGLVLLASGLALVVAVSSIRGIPFPWMGGVLCIVPGVLAIDLLWTGWRRAKAATGVS